MVETDQSNEQTFYHRSWLLLDLKSFGLAIIVRDIRMTFQVELEIITCTSNVSTDDGSE